MVLTCVIVPFAAAGDWKAMAGLAPGGTILPQCPEQIGGASFAAESVMVAAQTAQARQQFAPLSDRAVSISGSYRIVPAMVQDEPAPPEGRQERSGRLGRHDSRYATAIQSIPLIAMLGLILLGGALSLGTTKPTKPHGWAAAALLSGPHPANHLSKEPRKEEASRCARG
jgi:hypothetical protein